jgi:hypothetical protein
MNNDTITLAPNSLYICLTQLLVPGFHWGLYHVDAAGHITRHEWAEVKGRRDPGSPVEAYAATSIPAATEYDAENRFNLAFVKILGFAAPTAAYDFRARLETLEPDSASTSWMQNRKRGLSCRTWLIRALALLERDGLLARSDAEPVFGIEERVKAVGAAVDARLGAGEDVRTALTEV